MDSGAIRMDGSAFGDTAGEAARVVVERDQRLSRSLLWRLQRAFFERQGIEAWSENIVPHYATSNPYIAAAYARVVIGFLRDWHGGAAPMLDPGLPMYIVEMGAGSGRFAFHFLKRFLSVYTRSALKDVRVIYVMTDIAERTLAYWQAHPSLQPFVAQGLLDFARFDAAAPHELVLAQAGTTLRPGAPGNPMVVLANYVFDGIPQDAFAIDGGHVYESLVTLSSPRPEPDLDDPDLLTRLELSYRPVRITGAYYDDPDLERILRAYEQRLPDTTLLFPSVALRCLRYLRDLAADRLLLLSGDKGYSREEDLLKRKPPAIAVHGSFSMMVNYHAIGAYTRAQGGQILRTERRPTHLDISAYLFGQPPTGYVETDLAYDDAIRQGSPDDFFSLKQGIQIHYDALTLAQLLAYIRLSGWDSNIMFGCFRRLRERLDTASPTMRRELRQVVHQVWDTYYPIGEKRGLAFALGLLLCDMRHYAEALDYFRHSLRLYGPHPKTLYNMGQCHYGLHRPRPALECIDQALALDPAFGPAWALRITLQALLSIP